MQIKYDAKADLLGESITYCCQELAHASGMGAFGFGDINSDVPTGNTFNIYQRTIESDQYQIFPISFCPFCGAMVSIEEADMSGH